MFLGHLPYNCTFCPGPAYTGIGPAPITFAGATCGPITAGSPVYVNSSPLGSFFGIDPNIRTPYVQNWNVNIQQAITNKAVLQVGYVGSKGTKLFRFRDINQPSQSQITAYDTGPRVRCGYTAPNCPIAGFDSGSNVPRTAFPNFFYVNQEESTAGSNYNAAASQPSRDTGTDFRPRPISFGRTPLTMPATWRISSPTLRSRTTAWRRSSERGNSNFDIRSRFTWNFSYQFPKIRRHHGQAEEWLGSGRSAQPAGRPALPRSTTTSRATTRARAKDLTVPTSWGPIRYGSAPANFINLASFQVPCTFGNTTATTSTGDSNCLAGTRHFGNLGRNSLRGPSFKEFNFSVFKNTAITERVNLQLRAEFFNLFNHPELCQSGTCPTSSPIRRVNGIASTVAGRLLRADRNRRRGHRQSVPGWRRAARHSVRREVYVLGTL